MTLPPPASFDDFLERLLGGEVLDTGAFVRAHPELPEAERRQLLRLCLRPPDDDPSSGTAGGPGEELPDDAPPIDRIGGLKLGRRIGAGAMGAVFLAYDESLGRQVAVKILGPDLLGSGEQAGRFLREVRALAGLRHPNVVTIHAAGEEQGLRFMEMELVAGSSLHEVIVAAAANGSRLPVAEVLRLGSELARALEAAHAAGIIHRDVKPSNIRIATDGRAVLLDFGLAREAGAATLTEAGIFRGSPQYASPEQVGAGNVPIDARTDIYSLGATLYEALTGVAPFRGETREQLFHQILSREPVPLRKLEPSLPRDLETVILAALDKDPARRHPTAAALAADLEAVRDGRPVSVRPPSGIGRLARWVRRQPAKAALLISLMIAIPLVAALGGFILANLSKIEKATAAENARALGELLEDAFLENGDGDPARAVDLFEAALRLDPLSPEANAGFALARMEQKDPAAALAFLTGSASAFKSANWSLQIQAEALRRLEKTDESKKLSEGLSPPGPAIDHFVAGMLALDKFHRGGRHEVATSAFHHLRRAVQGSSTASPLYLYELGHSAWHGGRKDDARDVAASIQHLWPPSPAQEFAIGRMLLEADPKRAFDALEKAARAPPGSLFAREFIVTHLAESGRTDAIARAVVLGRELAAANPSRARSHAALGAAFLGQGDLDSAFEALSRAKKIEPDSSGIHCALAQLFFQEKRFRDAVVEARESLRLRPNQSIALKILGVALLTLDEPDEAVTVLKEVIVLAPDDPLTLCNLGRGLLRLGEFEKGLEHLEKGHALGSASSKWSHPSKRWVANAERLVALEKRLEEVRRGEGKPPTAEERLRLAFEVCVPKKRFAEAADYAALAFELDPTFRDRQSPPYRMEAASAAVSAGLGKGVNAPADDASRAKRLEHARVWFEAEIAECDELRLVPAQAASIGDRLKPWTKDRGLAAMREAATWLPLWKRCDALLESK